MAVPYSESCMTLTGRGQFLIRVFAPVESTYQLEFNHRNVDCDSAPSLFVLFAEIFEREVRHVPSVNCMFRCGQSHIATGHD